MQRSEVKQKSIKNNNAKTHSCPASPPRKRVKQSEQMFLDFGQKNFDTYTCPECQMPYSRGTVEDEAIHAKYHKAVVRGITYTSYKHEMMLQQFPEDNSRIMMLAYNQSNQFEKRKKKVEGCVIAEPITRAYKVSRGDNEIKRDEKMQVGTSNDGSAIFCFTKPIGAVCGINRVWVSKPYRRKGVATKLLDIVREKFVYGCILRPNDLAFSQPTGDGQAFAAKYTGTIEFLVYAED
ncbi:854_t:CDS:2 [Scutellospora calospora]|uniref:854_t:CDS:1 n=1 Tax=Scutellospora calospora TaxID=85575 RepID=A0ACA9KN51_9GLOM|nr:854_t:CDS:2 [Scutellospora calospora]